MPDSGLPHLPGAGDAEGIGDLLEAELALVLLDLLVQTAEEE
ncbi:MAG TPA: hypothetical protein PLC99_20520 [Verrucomicrobiota bacterium]|nr:hypothetical protein [Verrucomicrobiota bacterium]